MEKELIDRITNNIAQVTEIISSDANGTRGKRMGRILSSLTHDVINNPEKGEYLLEEISPIYDKLYKKHNAVFRKIGGKSGSGMGAEGKLEDVAELMNLEGVDINSFNAFQFFALNFGNFCNDVKHPFMYSINQAIWTALVSVHDSKLQEKLVKIAIKYDTRIS